MSKLPVGFPAREIYVYMYISLVPRCLSAVFFDFIKAFDTISHLPLLSKLQEIDLDPLWIYLAEKVVLNGKYQV